MAPTIIFVPGFWEGPEPFEGVSRLLADTGFQTMTCTLPSTGTTSPGNPGMHDDIAAIRSSAEAVIAEGTDVVMVLHSGGGFLGSNAMKGLSAKARSEQGLKGGVLGIVFLTGAVFPEGFRHGDLPFATEIKDGALLCCNVRETFFNDLKPAVTDKWVGKLKTQPGSGWNDVVTFCGWRDVPSVYLICETDQAIPLAAQIQMAEAAGSEIERCDAGHMVILSMPEKVAEVIRTAVATF